MSIYTIGHSTRPIGELIELLKAHSVKLLVDVRTIPGSRRNPQYSQAALEKSLPAEGIEYEWHKDLGGLRKTRADSNNLAWRNLSFRGYADYMQTPEFAAAIEKLITEAGEKQIAIMCAEAVPWRCHRSLIADALEARGIEVFHIQTVKNAPHHNMTPFAQIEGVQVSYPKQ